MIGLEIFDEILKALVTFLLVIKIVWVYDVLANVFYANTRIVISAPVNNAV